MTTIVSAPISDQINKDDTIHLTDVKPDPKKANPKVGPSQIGFSPDNRYVYSRNGECWFCSVVAIMTLIIITLS